MSADADAGIPITCIDKLTSIALTPDNSTVSINGAPTTVTFTATGTFADGHTEVLDPVKLAWTATRADATPPGTITNGSLVPNPMAGGVMTVGASDTCVMTSTILTLHLDVTVGTALDPAAWMQADAQGATATTAPLVVYPSDQTRFPRNIYRTLFQWRTQGFSQFRLTFEGPFSKTVVYSDGVNTLCAGKTPAAGCWEADELSWSYMAASNAGMTATWTLDALDTTGGTPVVRRAAPITIGFSKQDVQGAIFYWSTTSAGIRRANIRDAVPEDYMTGKPPTTYASPTDQVKCVACHVVSRDGKYLIAPVSASSGGSLWITEVTTTAPPTPLVKSIANTGGHGFATISPDDSTVVAGWKGKLWSLDRATGNKIEDLPLGAVKGTHPDWSPDNSQLVFATGDGDAPSGASIAVIPYLNPGWGSITTLVPSATKTNLFPMFSPDGNWIAYSRGSGGHGDLTAQLYVIGKAGGTAVELTNANRVVSNVLGNGLTENSQPTWAPPGDLYWIAFNSKREYGVVQKAGMQQIWVAAVDPAALAAGAPDPSYPAFRLQFQGLAENNHRAYWTLDVRGPPDGGAPDMSTNADMAQACIPGTNVCDPVLNSCCEPGYACDTIDNGATYNCTPPIM